MERIIPSWNCVSHLSENKYSYILILIFDIEESAPISAVTTLYSRSDYPAIPTSNRRRELALFNLHDLLRLFSSLIIYGHNLGSPSFLYPTIHRQYDVRHSLFAEILHGPGWAATDHVVTLKPPDTYCILLCISQSEYLITRLLRSLYMIMFMFMFIT